MNKKEYMEDLKAWNEGILDLRNRLTETIIEADQEDGVVVTTLCWFLGAAGAQQQRFDTKEEYMKFVIEAISDAYDVEKTEANDVTTH